MSKAVLQLTYLQLFFTSSVQRFINEDKLPHLLFYGPPGTGKTSTILACAKQLYKDKEFNSMVLEVRAAAPRQLFHLTSSEHCCTAVSDTDV